MTTIDPDLISIRDLSAEEIPKIIDYWYHSPPGFIEAMGVDLTKMTPENQFAESLREKCEENRKLPASKMNALVVFHENNPVGFHTINPLVENDFGIFHAHIWDPSFRGRGLGRYSYSIACKIFIDRFNLDRILFKTPLQNVGAIRVKEKLGVRCLGEEVINFGIIKENTKAKVFELTRSEAPSILISVGGEQERSHEKN